MKTILLCLTAVAQIALSVTAEPIQRIPLYYKRHNKDDFLSTAAQDLKNGMLGGVVQIGNPPQNFTVAFDTSTGFSWVRGIQCGDENCQGRQAFDSRNSTTIVSTGKSFTMNYGGGAIVYSTIYLDTFRYSGLTVKNMPFGGAYRMEGFNDGFDGYLGLGRNVNLSNTEVQYAKRDIPASGFVPNAYQQGSGVQSAQFGMYTTSVGSGFSDTGSVSSNVAVQNSNNAATSNTMSPNTVPPNNVPPNVVTGGGATSNNGVTSNSGVTSGGSGVTSGGFGHIKRHHEEPAGYLVIGGVDTDAIKGKLYHIKVSDDTGSGNWAVPVHEAKFEDDLYFKVNKKAKAVLSSSTDVIGLPNKEAEEFRKHWYAEYDKPDNTYKIPCCLMDRLTSFKIKFGKVEAVVPPQYWSHPRKVDSCCELCRTHIGRSESDTDYVIGSAFTNAFYTQFDSDKDRISLAMKKNHVKDGLSLCDA